MPTISTPTSAVEFAGSSRRRHRARRSLCGPRCNRRPTRGLLLSSKPTNSNDTIFELSFSLFDHIVRFWSISKNDKGGGRPHFDPWGPLAGSRDFAGFPDVRLDYRRAATRSITRRISSWPISTTSCTRNFPISSRKQARSYATTEPHEALLLGGNTAHPFERPVTQFGPTLEVFRRTVDLVTARTFADPPLNTIELRKLGVNFLLDDAIKLPVPAGLAEIADAGYTIGF